MGSSFFHGTDRMYNAGDFYTLIKQFVPYAAASGGTVFEEELKDTSRGMWKIS